MLNTNSDMVGKNSRLTGTCRPSSMRQNRRRNEGNGLMNKAMTMYLYPMKSRFSEEKNERGEALLLAWISRPQGSCTGLKRNTCKRQSATQDPINYQAMGKSSVT